MSGNDNNNKKVDYTQEAKSRVMAANVSYLSLPSRKTKRLQDV